MRPTAISRPPPTSTRRRWNSRPALPPPGSRSARRAKRWATARARARRSQRARDADPDDRHGAALHLARLGGADPATAGAARLTCARCSTSTRRASTARSRTFRLLGARDAARGRDDNAATRFGTHARSRLRHRARGRGVPRRMSTGSSGSICRRRWSSRRGAKGLYDRLAVGDIATFLAAQAGRGAASGDRGRCVRLCGRRRRCLRAVARVLGAGGLFAFTVETHDGEGAIVGAKMRYAHGEDFVRARIAEAGLTLRRADARRRSRTENRVPVPGLLVVARDDKRRELTLVARSTDPPNCPRSSRAGSRRAAGRRARISSNCWRRRAPGARRC